MQERTRGSAGQIQRLEPCRSDSLPGLRYRRRDPRVLRGVRPLFRLGCHGQRRRRVSHRDVHWCSFSRSWVLPYSKRCSRTSSDVSVESSIPNRQSFSHTYVEKKRYHRTLTAVINGVPVAEAIRQGLVEPAGEQEGPEPEEDATGEDDQSMFVPEDKPTSTPAAATSSLFGSGLSPTASTFTPTVKFGEDSSGFAKPSEKLTSTFGQPTTTFGSSGFGSPGFSGGFGSTSLPSSFGNPATGLQAVEPFSFGGFTQPPKEQKFNSAAPTAPVASQTSEPPLSGDSVKTPNFTGFGFGKAANTSPTTSTTTASVPSTSSAIPPFFGPRATLPAASRPAEGNYYLLQLVSYIIC